LSDGLRKWYDRQDKVSLLISFFVFLFSFGIYFKTMAPTVSFWDCGEFIACAYILGIPHPPGTPLFVVMARIFSEIPFFDQIAARVNLLSAITSALAVWLIYLVIVKLAGRWNRGHESLWITIGRYAAGIVGSLFVAFSMTFWSNAVEAEVYGLSMFMMMLMLYLALLWMDHLAEPKGDRLLVLIAYLALLSTGIHMTVFLVVPGLFLLIVLTDRRKLLDWRFWVTGLVLALVVHRVTPFLVALGAWLFITLMFSLSAQRKKAWTLCFLITLAGVAGYSCQLFIPIRSSLDPAVDENDPDNWASLKSFLERSQYGQESMISRMFYRRGSWANQLGTKERMGFWGFFREEYMHKGLWFIPTFLGLFGIWELVRKRKREGVVLIFLILACTLGLVFYMNFADGTRPDPLTGQIIRLEVRDRDYFFTPGFMFFALAMGLGAFGLIRRLGRLLENKSKMLQPTLGILAVILLILPLLALKKNYKRNDRTGNWIPYDYAYNHLMSCDKDGMLITNGDNDTFPLWFLQNVEKIRQDVRIINLSLLNADWYILQLKDMWKVPISLTYDQIKGIPTRMPDGQVVPHPREPYWDQIRQQRTYLFPHLDEKTGKFLRIQDLALEDIAVTNQWKYPFYFARTTPPSSRVGLDDHVVKEGLVDRLVPEEGKDMLDPVIFRHNLWDVYRYRGLADMNVYKDDNTIGLLMNYSERFIDLADYYRSHDQTEDAIAALEKSARVLPDYYRTYIQLYRIFTDRGEAPKADSLLTAYEKRMETLTAKYLELLLYHQYLALAYQAQEKFLDAQRAMEKAYDISPQDKMTFQILRQLYMINQEPDKLVKLLENWLEAYPSDQQTRQLLERYKNQQ
jgi:tetratricopeptide (TPR) repeat protein